ncbi:MAG: hypothetical protein VYE00_00830 [Candidatus Poribacteria bacterium]|nr:hypothetical protein [Candidatus Poribacteria bacterium]
MKFKTNRNRKIYTIVRGISWIPVLMLVLLCIAFFPDDSSAAKIIGTRYHHHPETRSTRVVFVIDGQIGSHQLHSPQENEIEVRLYNMLVVPGFDLDVNANDPILKDVLVKMGPGQSAILNLTSHQDIRRYKLFPLSSPNRIVIDLFGAFDSSSKSQPSSLKVGNRTDPDQNAPLSPKNPEEINESSTNSEEILSQTVFQNHEVRSGEPMLNIQELLDQGELVLGVESESRDISTSSSPVVWRILLGIIFLLLLGLVVLGILVLRSRRALKLVMNQEPVLPSQSIEEEFFQEDEVLKDVTREGGDDEDFEEILDNTISQELDTSNQPSSLKRAFIDHSDANHEEELEQVGRELDLEAEDAKTVDTEEEQYDHQGVKDKITELLGDDEILLGEVVGPELEEDEKLKSQDLRLSRRIGTARRLIDEGKSHAQVARELKTTREEVTLMLAIDKRS